MGQSAKPRGDYSLGAYASAVRDLLGVLGHQQATVVGHSLGGGVAMQLAYQFPERCGRLVLVSEKGAGAGACGRASAPPRCPVLSTSCGLRPRAARRRRRGVARVLGHVGLRAGAGPRRCRGAGFCSSGERRGTPGVHQHVADHHRPRRSAVTPGNGLYLAAGDSDDAGVGQRRRGDPGRGGSVPPMRPSPAATSRSFLRRALRHRDEPRRLVEGDARLPRHHGARPRHRGDRWRSLLMRG